MKYSFTFYWNAQRAPQGYLVGFLEGYQPGHRLEIAYRGLVSVLEDDRPRASEHLLWVAEILFAVFNDESRRPACYRGPSMSVGNVVEIQGVCFAVAPLGFEPVEIWQSEITPCDEGWIRSGECPEELA